MAKIEQILQHQQRVGAFRMQPIEPGQRRRRVAAQHALQQIEDLAAIGDAEHVAHHRLADPAIGERDRLVEQGEAVAHRAVGGPRDQRQRLGLGLDHFGFGDPAVVLDQQLDRHPAQRKALAARQHGYRHLVDFGGGQHEDRGRRRLFERLQQRVEGLL